MRLASSNRLLRRHRLGRAPSGAEDDGYVFVTRNGTPIDGDNLSGAWARALRKAGIRSPALHALRHQSGASVKAVQTVVGHSSASLTLQVYSHMLPADLDALAARMAGCDPSSDPAVHLRALGAPESMSDDQVENATAMGISAWGATLRAPAAHPVAGS